MTIRFIERARRRAISLAAGAALLAGCTEGLDVVNPNEPTPVVLATEEGMRRQATGIYGSLGEAPGYFDLVWFTWTYHEGMGDAIPSRVGNFGFVDVTNPEKVIYSDGTVHSPIATRSNETNPQTLARLNDRNQGEPTVLYEWREMYEVNNEANLILQILESGDVRFGGDATAKEQGYRAWAYWWKGYAYSRIASMYEQGLIIDTFGETNNDYKTTAELVAEANRMFDLAIQHAAGFDAISGQIVPDLFTAPAIGKPTSASLIASANTLKARNLLVNKYKADLTAADWQQIEALTAQGLQTNANTFILRFDQSTFGLSAQILYRTAGTGGVWSYASERLIQEFDPADQRLRRHFTQVDANADSQPDFISGYTGARGYNHVTTWLAQQAAEDPVFETTVGGSWLFLVSAEENLLMAAEAKLALGRAGEAADLVNQVRQMQDAGLPALDASTINDEVIRRERRTALVARGLAFYDARRLKIILPEDQGGGRTGAWVWKSPTPGGVPTELDKNATIIYNFRPYWPVPVHELTFNTPSDGGTPGEE